MNKAFLAGMVMQLSVLLLPPLQGVFSVCPMDLTQWVTVLALALAPIPICEAEKALRRRRPEAEEPRQGEGAVRGMRRPESRSRSEGC